MNKKWQSLQEAASVNPVWNRLKYIIFPQQVTGEYDFI